MLELFKNCPLYLMALIATIFTWSITAIGSSIVFFFKKVNPNILDAMLSLSAGVMIAASFWSLLNPAINLASKLDLIPWLVVLIGFLGGGIFLYLGDTLLKKKMNSNYNHGLKRCIMLIFSITLHNIPEGLSIGVAFGSLAYNYTDQALMGAILLAIGIGIQNFPEGCAVSLPLRREGFSRKKSFLIGNLSGIVEPISAVVGCLLVLVIQNILPFFLAFAAGAMIYVVVEELIPESQKNKNKELMTFMAMIGFAIMMVLDVALG